MTSPHGTQRFLPRLGVCSWSLQPDGPRQLVGHLKTLGIDRIQLDLDPFRERPDIWKPAPAVFADNDVKAVSGMFRTVGEDYSSLESIRITGGVVPDETWDENWANAEITARTAALLGLDLVTFHAGFMPHDTGSEAFDKLAGRVRSLARLFADSGISLSLETGQETAEELRTFLEVLDEPNVTVNFDPANMLLYGKGDPIEALHTVGPWVRGVHLKDADVTRVPGTWGEEKAVGTGEVDWTAFFAALDEIDYDGWLCHEREAGDRRLEDIRAGNQFVLDLLSE